MPASSYLPSVVLEGSFPSGHSLRSAFFGTFLAVLTWNRRSPFSRPLAVAVLAIAPAVGVAMLYTSWNWASDVVADLLLGASVALLVAPALAGRIASSGPERPLNGIRRT